MINILNEFEVILNGYQFCRGRDNFYLYTSQEKEQAYLLIFFNNLVWYFILYKIMKEYSQI